jgi:hypothetical protein
MDKIPKSIEDSIRKSARHYDIANKEFEKVREWLFKNNYDLSITDFIGNSNVKNIDDYY